MLKKIYISSLFVFVCSIAQAGFQTYEVKNYNQVINLTEIEVQTHSKDDLLVVFDIDHTLLETENCLDGPDVVTGGFWLFEERVKRCNGLLTSPQVPDFINDLKDENIAVMALTARRGVIAEATVDQLSNRLIYRKSEKRTSLTFETAPLYSSTKFVVDYDFLEVFERPMTVLNGVSLVAGGDKGISLRAYLEMVKEKTGREFKRIIFVDDKKRNIRNLERAFDDTKTFISILHYTEYID